MLAVKERPKYITQICLHGNYKETCFVCEYANNTLRYDTKKAQSSVIDLISQGKNEFTYQTDNNDNVVITHESVRDIISQCDDASDLIEKGITLDNDFANSLIESNEIDFLADNINRFKNLNYQVAKVLISQGEGCAVLENREVFISVSQEQLKTAFFAEGDYAIFVEYLDLFGGLDKKEIVKELMANGHIDIIITNLEIFGELIDHKKFAKYLMRNNSIHMFVFNLDKFRGLDLEVAEQLIDKGFGEYVVPNLNSFDGVTEKDLVHIYRGRIAKLDKSDSSYLLQNVNAQAVVAV